jgi:flagellar M-ring protein FliF
MSDLVPAPAAAPGPSPTGLLTPLTDRSAGGALPRLRAFAAQPAIRRTLPWFGGLAALGGTALLWAVLSPAPQRTLYSQLSDAGRAGVVAALDKAAIPYTIDNATGALTVGEDDLYKARMLVAADGGVAAPQGGDELLDAMPMGASRTMEAQRLRSARERELQLTIMEIEGVEAVRVHLGEAEKSVFVRDNIAPTASVMVKLARGRQLAQSQVAAIRNLVAASAPGLTVDAVKVVDQQGRLLSEGADGEGDRFDLQSRMEDKLRRQLAQLLTPMLGEDNFSSEIQVDLDMDEVTSARESYDKQGVVRSETQAASQAPAGTGAVGVPGVLSNTPPPPTTAQPGAPQGTPPPGAPAAPGTTGESSATRLYELGREVQVANAAPGKVRRLTVAVALSAEAMKQAKAQDIQQIKNLVSAAVGADPARGDQVEIVVRSFQPAGIEAEPIWQTPWFLGLVRSAVALLAVLLVLLLGVRPLIRALKGEPARQPLPDLTQAEAPPSEEAEDEAPAPSIDPQTGAIDQEQLGHQVGFAQRLAAEKPDSAVTALRQMLAEPEPEPAR